MPQRLLYALALFVFGQVLADVMILTFTPLYGHYADQSARVSGISPLTDQRLAGFVMMTEQAITLGTFALLIYKRRYPYPCRCAGNRLGSHEPQRPVSHHRLGPTRQRKPTGRVIMR